MSGLQVRVAGTWRPLKTLYVFHLGAWRRLKTLKMWDGTAWRVVANFVPTLSVTVSPATAYGFANPPKPMVQTVTTTPLTAIPSGGVAPYAYDWSITSHTGTSPVLNSPHSASTAASATVAANTEQVATAHVIVTDALGSVAEADGHFDFVNES